MSKKCFRALMVRVLLLFVFACPMRVWSVGWTPTDCGLVLNFEPGDQFLLSVMIDGTEYFVCDYPTYTGGKFKYTAGDYLKLIPQAAGATEPSAASVWTVDTALTRISGKNNFSLGGISYTMWGNTHKTLVTSDGSFKYKGALTDKATDPNLCDVVFAVPTVLSATNADPNNTLKKGGKFDGAMGVGFAGMIYREVYLFDIPRSNTPNAYVNASLVTFNTTSETKSWNNNSDKVAPGKVYFAFADTKHHPTTRTLFRIYPLNKPFSSCNSYFFGWDVQDYKRYRQSNTMTDSTAARKIYTLDHFVCMEPVNKATSTIYKTDGMHIPPSDSTYFYVGYRNNYCGEEEGEPLGSGSAYSLFEKISELRIDALKDAATPFTPPAGAFGRMVVDTASNDVNLGVSFEPSGYFLKVSTGKNVRMRQTGEHEWTCDEMWTITPAWAALTIKATLMTGPDFREDDPGADIDGWSKMVKGTSVPVIGADTIINQSGWARIYTNKTDSNGGMVFVLANKNKWIQYHNNGLIGIDVPRSYPAHGETTVTVENARLKAGFTFLGWATEPEGDVVFFPADSDKPQKIGDVIDLAALPTGVTLTGDTVLHLYAKGTFNDTYRVAFSFMRDGKRYFLTHPNSSAPRFARARTFTDWTDVYQGMSDAENSKPNYISTYKMIGHPTCELCTATEYVLDPRHEMVHGVEDSLTFYEYWTPANDEFIGLYYLSSFNTVLANNTWAGAFKSTKGWPAYDRTAVDDTKLYSENYFTGMNTGVYEKHPREEGTPATPLPAYIQYDAATNQFNGVAEEDATEFQITGIAVADAHYVILPDTTDETTPWRDAIIFGLHENEILHEQVWSRLIGKQLMACLRVGKDTVYFHPNRDKIFNSASELRLSADFRLTHAFEYIHDKRVATPLAARDSVLMEETENAFCCNIHSSISSPMNIKDAENNDIDIVDTLRVWLRPGGISKIKEYYGRWSEKDAAVKVMPNGSRYRDILVTTKTYHYGGNETRLEILPEYENYNLSALANKSLALNFILRRVTYRPLLGADNVEVGRDIISIDTIANKLALTSSMCSLRYDSIFSIVSESTASNHVTLKTKEDNTTGIKIDTLTVTIPTITVDAVTYTDVTVRVPLTQTSLYGNQLVWSVEKDGKRYFILANATGLIFREFSLRGNTLYKKDTWNHLKKGAASAANTDIQYITPWEYAYPDKTNSPDQVILQAVSPVSMYFAADETPTVGVSPTALTFDLIASYTNTNANYEEKVRLKVAEKWLKFTGSALELTPSSSEASEFYWGYLQEEYNLLNNGDYPSVEEVVIGYNSNDAKSVQTRYKVYREYSMLLNNTLTYLCREEESDIADLQSGDWKTAMTITRIPDARTFDKADPEDPDIVSGLGISVNTGTLTTTITPSSFSPVNVTIDGKYVNIVDTLDVALSLQEYAPTYRFKDWKGVSSIEDAHLKIPLIRQTFHMAPFDSISCSAENDEYNYSFPATLPKNKLGEDSTYSHTFSLQVAQRTGTNVFDVDNNVVSYTATSPKNLTPYIDLNDISLAEVRLVDVYGNAPDWCEITAKEDSTVTVQCTKNGLRSPRSAYIYLAFIVDGGGVSQRFVNYRLTVSQASRFQYANNQHLVHSTGASGDPLVNGMQQVHENRRILYYYNPEPYNEPDQNVELPVRERSFYGWWRWYREGLDENNFDCSDMDIFDSMWIAPPRNVGRYNFPFRIIGDSVKVWDAEKEDSIKKLVTMGRYTVFHYPSAQYASKNDPPAKSPYVQPPHDEKVVTYVVDLGNYYDNLPLQIAHVNQIDTAALDTMREIIEPTLSLREIFELRPWTEMAERMENYKTPKSGPFDNDRYMEDHVVMAPLGNRLLLKTEQRYRYENLHAKGHSESLLGYYMRDDNWDSWAGNKDRQDTMIWCGGWDANCMWYTYTKAGGYAPCRHSVTVDDDFLNVPAKASITAGKEYDTVYYCLRANSMRSTFNEEDLTIPPLSVPGDYMFNICRYMVVYHNPQKFGPLQEKTTKGTTKALISNDEIEQNYEVLERLNFDYNKPGKEYRVYPHPLPWADASYGYSYPVSPEIPDNRYHNDFAPNFPGVGEYGLVNRIPYANYWHKMEQHGGAENGYMIYCDGMNSSGQVAALSLESHLCEGQKMYFSAYVGNPSNQKGKANPNFTFSVQGWNAKDSLWDDITTYMTGDITPSNQWYQIFFPIEHEMAFDRFRVRIYNMASDFDGNDFIIDDICVFATKPPLIAYQADTKCVENEAANDSVTNVVLRIDYQGFVGDDYNNRPVYYTVQKTSASKDTSFLALLDKYMGQDTVPVKGDTLYGAIRMPGHEYVPADKDSVFANLSDLVTKFEKSYLAWKADPSKPLYREGYIYENLDGEVRPVLYVIHTAKMTPDNIYTVRLSLNFAGLMNSKCAMTSNLKVSNRMTMELNGVEQGQKEIIGMCTNTTYDISLRVNGSLLLSGVAPIDQDGSCVNDWLLYGDTVDTSSEERYGYKYSDIVKTVKEILRCEPASTTNANQFAPNLASVSRNEMLRVQSAQGVSLSDEGLDPYTIVSDLVNNGFLTLYKSKMTVTVTSGDSVQYIILPIIGTGTDNVRNMEMEVCPTPIFVKLKPDKGGATPLTLGGVERDSTQKSHPLVILADALAANTRIVIPIDSIMSTVALHSITLLDTDDPEFLEGVQLLNLLPNKEYDFSTGGDNSGYYKSGDDLILTPAPSNTYTMRQGYNYTFAITMQTRTGSLTLGGEGECPVGTVTFTVSVVPDYLRWAPMETGDNRWNNPMNWIGITSRNEILHENARYAPLPSTDVIIPAMPDTLLYPVLPDPSAISSADSVKQVGFAYNSCDDIRFLAGAAMSQQQRLNCDVVVVDMTMPYDKWAFRSSPVTGMISGDLFMANADLSGETKPWSVGSFDASGRSYRTGNASFWLSVYSQETRRLNKEGNDSIRTADADWSRVTNAMTLPLMPAQGWAVYSLTASEKDAVVRLPKSDDIYYYYGTYGEQLNNRYEPNLIALRDDLAGSGSGNAGKLAYTTDAQTYTLRNNNTGGSSSFVFGNPTMGYIDIWGFIADNCLTEEFAYMDESGAAGIYREITKAAADASANTIINRWRYLPPMHAMVVQKADGAANELEITLKATRIVTETSQCVAAVRACGGGAAPAHRSVLSNDRPESAISKGIMTITALNPVSPICTSYLLLGQGYDAAVREGEDAVLTTICIDDFSMVNAPATPFNLYAAEGSEGLSVDLRDSIVNVPISFYISDLPYDPITRLWFTGVHNIDGPLMFYDALTDTERPIIDGSYIDIETPQQSHLKRYYIRRRSVIIDEPQEEPIATGFGLLGAENENAVKIVQNGNVYIVRNGHIYTIFGQQVR